MNQTEALRNSRFSWKQLSIFILAFALIGAYFLWRSFAASPVPTISGTITLTANVTDDTGVSWVHFKLDNDVLFLGMTENFAQAKNGPFSMSWDTKKFPNGVHTVTAVAYDPGGHVVSSNTITVDVENAGSTVTQSSLLAKNIYQTDKQWTCTGTVNLDSVTVLMVSANPANSNNDAIHINNCGGTIGRINVVEYFQDGMKLNGSGLTINSGIIRCYARNPSTSHQDGVQSIAGSKNTVNNLDDRCYTGNNSNWYMTFNTSNPGTPGNYNGAIDNICNGCTLGSGPPSNLFVGSDTMRSGARNTVVCPGLGNLTVRIGDNKNVGLPPINPIPNSNSAADLAAVGDSILSASDGRCAKPPGLGTNSDNSPPTITLLTPSSNVSSGGGGSTPPPSSGGGSTTPPSSGGGTSSSGSSSTTKKTTSTSGGASTASNSSSSSNPTTNASNSSDGGAIADSSSPQALASNVVAEVNPVTGKHKIYGVAIIAGVVAVSGAVLWMMKPRLYSAISLRLSKYYRGSRAKPSEPDISSPPVNPNFEPQETHADSSAGHHTILDD